MREIKDHSGLEKKYSVHCPHCWTKNTLEIEGNYKVIASHPLIAPVPHKFHQATKPFWMFWTPKYPKGVREGTIECENCGYTFYVGLFPNGYEDLKNSKDLNYYLSIIKGENPVGTKFLLEDILDCFSSYFKVKYPLNCFFLIFILFVLFLLLPAIPLGGLSKISHDYLLPFILIFSSLMLVFLKRHYIMLMNTLNLETMPLLLSKQYKNSNLSKQLEETLRGWIFGHPFQTIKPPTFSGLVAVIILLIWHVNYVTNICSTFYETPYAGLPIDYTSYATAIIGTPFWIMIYFIIGNIIWFFLATTVLIGLITKNIPLKINLLKKMGGTEIFGRIILSVVYTTTMIGVQLPISLFWSSGQEFYVLLISVALVSIFVFLMIFGFFYPLWPIHKELKRQKEKEINRILSNVSLSSIEREMSLKDAMHSHLLLDISNKVSSMNEWPFKTDTIIKLFSTVLLPFTSLAINILIFTH
jgi:hypothetical protein